MKIDFGSLAFNININGKVGGTPSWGTAIVYQNQDNKIKEELVKDILIGMIYKKIDCTSKMLSLPLGKGGKVYYGDDDFVTNGAPAVPYLAARFEKTYVNGIPIGKPFILLIVKDGYDAHNGRLQLKYSPKIMWGDYKNQEFFDEAFTIFNISQKAPFVCCDISIVNQDELHFKCAYMTEEYVFSDAKEYNTFVAQEIDVTIAESENDIKKDYPLQQIYYGAPGTGKSHRIKELIEKYNIDEKTQVFRTTFHPDSDYSTFVGAYKPTMKEVTIYHPQTGDKLVEDKIVYTFTPQSFLKAYIAAWNALLEESEKPVVLVIEEINRGNCAQIFGDLFQLLDRDENGVSEYPIKADDDLCKLLQSGKDTEGADLLKNKDGIANGELCLPSNLYIWATMNTSDQSLFPIDSAFKRRWDWQYMPIVDAGKKWKIVTEKKEYDWWSFLEKINVVVGDLTSSEDKKLGYFFCKAVDGVIDVDKFVNKVIFYLWNDVVKDYDLSSVEAFKDVDGKSLTFEKFYKDRERVIEKLMMNLGVEVIGDKVDENLNGEEDDDGNTASSNTRDYSKYSINGSGEYAKNILASKCVEEYIKFYPDMSVDDVLKNWKGLGQIVPHFIESLEEHNARTDKSNRFVEIKCHDTFIYVERNGYGNNGAVDKLKDAINEKDWGIKIEKVK